MAFLRSRCSIEDSLKYLSHLDILKVVERALRRAGIPVAFSQGFNPHPQIAFGPARSVGLASSCEYFDVELKTYLDPEEFKKRLQEQCPQGLVIQETKEIPPGTGALMAVLNCAAYEVKIKSASGFTQEDLNRAINNVFNKEEIIVRRHSPKGTKESNIRPGILALSAVPASFGVLVSMEVTIGSAGNVKPGEVIDALHLNECIIVDMIRTGLFIRQPDGVKLAPE